MSTQSLLTSHCATGWHEHCSGISYLWLRTDQATTLVYCPCTGCHGPEARERSAQDVESEGEDARLALALFDRGLALCGGTLYPKPLSAEASQRLASCRDSGRRARAVGRPDAALCARASEGRMG